MHTHDSVLSRPSLGLVKMADDTVNDTVCTGIASVTRRAIHAWVSEWPYALLF